MTTMRINTLSGSAPDLFRHLLPRRAALDFFDTEDCDDSDAREHVVDSADDGAAFVGAEREVA